MIFNQLQSFRQTLYDSLGNARDAMFDLMDAVLVSACLVSFVRLSQSPVFRRQWSSTYAALQDSDLPRSKVLKLLVSQIPTDQQPLLAGDASRWSRPAAKHLRDRTFVGGAGSAITLGHSYSTLAWIPEAQGSWALPLRHERITSFETPASRAAFQLKQVTRQLKVRLLAVYDRGYGNASFVNGDRSYWATRMGKHPELPVMTAKLLKQQRGLCSYCKLYFASDDLLEVHHVDGNHQNDKWDNLTLLHQHCHDQVHSGVHDQHPVVEKPCEATSLMHGFVDQRSG